MHSKRADRHKHAVGVSVRMELQCRDSGFVQSVCRCVAFWAIAGLLESKRPRLGGLWVCRVGARNRLLATTMGGLRRFAMQLREAAMSSCCNLK
jgi:hypothetical protein